MNLDESCTIQLDTNTLANDFGREHQILQNGIMHRGQSATKKQNQDKNRLTFHNFSSIQDIITYQGHDIYNQCMTLNIIQGLPFGLLELEDL